MTKEYTTKLNKITSIINKLIPDSVIDTDYGLTPRLDYILFALKNNVNYVFYQQAFWSLDIYNQLINREVEWDLLKPLGEQDESTVDFILSALETLNK